MQGSDVILASSDSLSSCDKCDSNACFIFCMYSYAGCFMIQTKELCSFLVLSSMAVRMLAAFLLGDVDSSSAAYTH